VLLPEAKDYKRVGMGDTGLNTGGMGAISPVPFADAGFMQKVKARVIEPTITGLQKDDLDYKGFIFFGLMKVNDEPFVIEYNCRMGDPETEVVMPRIKNDLCDLLEATALQRLNAVQLQQDDRCTTTIVAVSGGYPNDYEKGYEITGIPSNTDDVILFYAGAQKQNGRTVTTGGRVVCATALGATLEEAISKSKNLAEQVSFTDKYFRKDIGYEFL
jgi:phosphoribosylamine--glycine ligase